MTSPLRKALKGRRALVLGGDDLSLSVAITMALRGARVVVLTDQKTLDGFAPATTLADEYAVPHFPGTFSSPGVLAALFAEAGYRLNEFVTLERVDVLAEVALARRIKLQHDPGMLAAELAAVDKNDAASLPRFFRLLMAARHGAGCDVPAAPLLASGATPRWSADIGLSTLAASLRLDPRSDAALIAAHVRSPELRRFWLGFSALSGICPYSRSRAYLAWLGEWLAAGGWRIAEGNAALTGALRKLAELLGIQVLTGCRVEQIQLQDGRLRQVTGQGFKPIPCSLLAARHGGLLRPHLPPAPPASPLVRRFAPTPRAFAHLDIAAGMETTALPTGIPVVVPPVEPREERRFRRRWQLPAPDSALAMYAFAGITGEGVTPYQLMRLRALVPVGTRRFKWGEAQCENVADLQLTVLKERVFTELRMADVESEAELVPLPQRSDRPLPPGVFVVEDYAGSRSPHGSNALAALRMANAISHLALPR